MRYLFFITICAAIFACHTNDKKETPQEKEKREQKDAAAVSDSANSTMVWLDPVSLDLGTITKGQIVELSWKFKNTGNKPLTITNVSAGCGCTTPDPPKEPIAPGAEGVIKAKFNSENFSGSVTKEVNVQALNGDNKSADYKLSFSANIKE